MAVLKGVNYTFAFVNAPPKKIHQGEWNGKTLTMIDKYTLLADAADADTIKVGRLPAGALVLGARVFGADLGGTGTLKLGNTASNDGSATDAADDDSFIKAADSSGQAFDVSDSSSAAMRGASIQAVRLATECDVELKFVGATSGATGVTIYTRVSYIVD